MQYLVLEPVVHIQLPYIYDSKFNNIFIDSLLFSITGDYLSWKAPIVRAFYSCSIKKFLFFRPSILFQRTTLSRVTVKFLQLMSTSTFFWHHFFKFLFLFNFFTTSSVLVSSRNFQFFPVFYILHQLPCFLILFLGGMFTANTMSSVVETLGLSLPGLWWFSYQLISSPRKMTFLGKFLWSQKFSSNAGALPLNNVGLQLWC